MAAAAEISDVPILDLRRWARPVTDEEDMLLRNVTPPVLDVGCGPGRFVEALHSRGVDVLGIDAALSAVSLARTRGVRVRPMSVFDDIPNAGSWATVLLLDGNVGIGGDPVALMARVRELLRPGGRALVELESSGVPTRSGVVQFEVARGMVGWFPWCWVSADDASALAGDAGFTVVSRELREGRSFAWLRRTEGQATV